MQDKRGDPPELLDVDYSTPVPLSDHERMRRMKEYDEMFERSKRIDRSIKVLCESCGHDITER